MTSQRHSCLFVLSAAPEGVSAQSFIPAFTLAQSAFNVQLASPQGRSVEFVDQDEQSRKWLADFRTKSFSQPAAFTAIEASRFFSLVIPHSPGAVTDLASDKSLAVILSHFIQEKKTVCGIGMGVAGLFCAKSDSGSWLFEDYSLTAASVHELAWSSLFSSSLLVPEDFIRDNGATYSCSVPGSVHVVIDRHVVTAQNEASTLTAVQNVILLSNQRPTV